MLLVRWFKPTYNILGCSTNKLTTTTYSKEFDSSFLHQFRLVRHVLEVLGIVQKLLFLTEKYLSQLDGYFSTLLQSRKYYPKRERGGEEEEDKSYSRE